MHHDRGFPKRSAHARRAPSAAGFARLDQSDVEKLHGMGQMAMAALRDVLSDRGRSFRG